MDSLFIPTKINKNDKYGKGFGKKEMVLTVRLSAVGLIIGLAAGIFFFNQGIASVLISIIIAGTLFAAIGYFLFLRTDLNLSIFDFICQQIRFSRTQNIYLFKKGRTFY